MDQANSIASISALAFMDEAVAMRALLARVEKLQLPEAQVMAQAGEWTRVARKRGLHGVESFLHAYSLSTSEGVALMCLAEALLRIPDAKTADAMIEGALEGRHWENVSADSWLISMSGWGLLLGGKVTDFRHDGHRGVIHSFKMLLGKLGEPLLREALKKAMQMLGGRFVLGQSVKEALAHAEGYRKKGYRFSFDILGEGVKSDAQALENMDAYREGIALIGRSVQPGTPLFEAPGISIKLSALHARFELRQEKRVMEELLPRVMDIMRWARAAGIAVAIDAEESTRLDMELLLFERLVAAPELKGWDGIGFVLQAYQKRAFTILDWLGELTLTHKRVIPIRLVKGAYWDSEIKWAQALGLPSYPVFTRKEHTDVSYLACADKMLSGKGMFYPQFATHNARTLASVLEMAKAHGWEKGSFELQRLFGMGEALHDEALAHAPSRIYAPIGPHKALLAYLIRRMLENGANSSFVHLLMDESKTVEEILADPVALTREHAGLFDPPIRLPADIYPDRKNSAGMDFGNLAQLKELAVMGYNVPSIADITSAELEKKLTTAHAAFPAWTAKPVAERAGVLEKAAELLEAHRDELVALLALEAKKTLPDGISEVREAADYCRYYAACARQLCMPTALAGPAGESNILSLHGRGVFACISPWNFPLAIFCGQVAAALAAGNCVLAKPAEQTKGIAALAVALLHEAGVPKDVLQLAPGSGEVIGAALVGDKRISGVAFTGGTDTATSINKILAARGAPIIPLIAETGGQNCMLVDSSALLEQAVDDIIASAFGSAGQRCSSLRVLFVQDEVADELLELLDGAMAELRLGDPLDVATDIGPVIDPQAREALEAHIEAMSKTAKLVAKVSPVPAGHVGPHVFEINNIGELTKENFGPILHVIRFAAGTLAGVADAINSTGYGLTFGIHSRVDAHVRLLAGSVRAGNIYVNRSMIGATVGVQPFGGEGLSGTGPKAGGPHYLLRFALERVITINTAAIGGNVALLTGDTHD